MIMSSEKDDLLINSFIADSFDIHPVYRLFWMVMQLAVEKWWVLRIGEILHGIVKFVKIETIICFEK